MKELRMIVAGSREFRDYALLSDALLKYLIGIKNTDIVNNLNQVVFVSGTARGADTLGEQFASTWNYKIEKFPANWNLYGKRAGYIRNEQMAKYAVEDGNYGVLFAFWDGQSKGTKHMIDLAKKYGLEVHVINY